MNPYRVAQPVASISAAGQRFSVDVSITEHSCTIGSKPPIILEMNEGGVRTHNRDFIGLMGKVRDQVVRARSMRLEPKFFHSVMSDLRDAGRSAYNSLGEAFQRDLDENREAARGRELGITIKAQDFPLLWECVYDGSAVEPAVTDVFWGYRYPVSRFLIGTAFLAPQLDPYGGFLFCRNHRLMHWQDEMSALQELAAVCGFVTLDECLDSPDPVSRQFALHDQALRAFTQAGAFSFVHMASHLVPDPQPEGELGALLVISYRESEIRITLRRVNAVRNEWRFPQHPLVFLNACRTMANPERLLQREGFPHSFLNMGAGAVIATACDIPDRFAAEFASKFYEYFLDRHHAPSLTASEALRRARRFFLEEYNNPLGLAYGLYAYDHLVVAWQE